MGNHLRKMAAIKPPKHLHSIDFKECRQGREIEAWGRDLRCGLNGPWDLKYDLEQETTVLATDLKQKSEAFAHDLKQTSSHLPMI